MLQPLDRLREPFVADRLQQVIDGGALECVERVLIVGGDEHDLHLRVGGARDVESGKAGHPDVEERDIRRFGDQQRLRIGTVARHARDHELGPQDRQALACRYSASRGSSSAMMAVVRGRFIEHAQRAHRRERRRRLVNAGHRRARS